MQHSLRRIAAVLILALAAASAAAAQSRETERVDRTLPLQPGGTLKLKNFSGDIRITGADAAEVSIHAVRRATRERLNRIKLSIESVGDTVNVNANDREYQSDERDNVVETSFEIRVPRKTNLDVHSFSSTITIDDVEGRHKINNFSGDLRLTRLSGPIRAKTFSGAIGLETTDSGNDLDLDTFSGEVRLMLPQNAGANLRFESFSGDLRTDLPVTLVRKSRRNLQATLNGGGTDVRVKTFSGDIHLGR